MPDDLTKCGTVLTGEMHDDLTKCGTVLTGEMHDDLTTMWQCVDW